MPLPIDRPVFFVGQGRSGTTLLFEAFSRHRDVGGILNLSDRWPTCPQLGLVFALLHNHRVSLLGRKPQHDRLPGFNKLMPKHAEGYRWWDAAAGADLDFARSFLRNRIAEPGRRLKIRAAVASLLFWQRKQRFAAKITGPTRMIFLDSVFPDSRFVHVIRDGRAVTHSLMRQPWWRKSIESPRWIGGILDSEIEAWRRAGSHPEVLTALQWRRVVEVAWEERQALLLQGDRYLEVRYEDFVSVPHLVLRSMFEFCDLEDSQEAHEDVDRKPPLRDMNSGFERDFDQETKMRIIEALGEPMKRLGYLS